MSGTRFVVDIGTRFVRGLLCRESTDAAGRSRVSIVDREIIEHETRAMRAGQIHDVEAVAQVVRRVRDALAQRSGTPLQSVAVAVAGRNLLTCRGTAECPRSFAEVITAADVRKLEIAAVQNALEATNGDDAYYCVGYSLVSTLLDGQEIATLVDHRGESIAAEALVTLLPRPVLEAMFAVMAKVGLEISYVTLEPIAALESTVAEQLRPLNLVLVDIGAGTADIAVTAAGKVLAYGMVPVAGDMITEALCQEYHADFFTAERLKRAAAAADDAAPLALRNIFDREITVSCHDVREKLRQPVRHLAERIAAEVAAIVPAAAAPRYAVILVGGGSMTPLLEEEVAAAFALPREQVGTRPASFNRDIDDLTGSFSGPDAATVTGIALLAQRRPGLAIMHLAVNDRRVTMITDEQRPAVLSALLASGFTLRQVYGRPGMAKTFTLNGALMTVKGGLPRPAAVHLNGSPVDLDALVQEGDRLQLVPAVDGADADQTIAAALALPRVWFNGAAVALPVQLSMNGRAATPETPLEDRADIRCSLQPSLHALLRQHGIDPAAAVDQNIILDVNGEYRIEKSRNYTLRINGEERPCADDAPLTAEARIEFAWREAQVTLAAVVGDCPPSGRDMRVRINGQDCIIPGGQGKVLVNGREASPDTALRSGDSIRTVAGKDAEAVLVDVFRYIDVNPREQAGKRLRLLINGRESNYTSVLQENADVSVLFE